MQPGRIRHHLTQILIALSLTVFAVQSSHAGTGGELVQLFSPFPHHFNSAITDNRSVTAVGANVFAFLTSIDASGDIEPYLADTWGYSDDGLTLTFYLRSNTIFHDGRPVRAHDVLFSYTTFRKHHPLGEQILRKVSSAEVVDEQTLVFQLSKPDPALLRNLSAPFMPILPEHIFGKGDIRRNPANLNPIGSGPFRVSRFQFGETFTLERFDGYLKPGLPLLDRIIGLNGENPLYAISLLKDGTAHLFNFVARPDTINLISGLEILRISASGYEAVGAMNYLEFNLRKKPLALLRVRQAIAHAIDPATLGMELYGDRFHSLDGPLPPGCRFFKPAEIPRRTDPGLAERLLDEAGLPRNQNGVRFETRLTWLPDFSGTSARAAKVIQERLGEVGIRVVLDDPGDESDVWLNLARWRHHMILSHVHALDDPSLRLHSMFNSRQMIHRCDANTSGFSNEQADVLLEAAESETDPEIRRQLYGQLQDLIREQLPLFFLHAVPYVSVIHRDLEIPISGRGVLSSLENVSWNPKSSEKQPDGVEKKENSGPGFFRMPNFSN